MSRKKLIYLPCYRGFVAIDSIMVIDMVGRTIRLKCDNYIDNVPTEQLEFVVKVMGAYYEN